MPFSFDIRDSDASADLPGLLTRKPLCNFRHYLDDRILIELFNVIVVSQSLERCQSVIA